ncbi:SDR family oxidoreductase [Fulvivirga lutimaris]|uniref:SDR family oxidoreductase n=1 Tax=Fulvivirga lutimaris TaxID=1819566 RepID=UPI0012BD1C35|nr:SDR family oxidoreductase [Fulvivirga lutimaris]MTI38486.1 SDR family oxidoreductase [Fulvivirga lutimaris]
MDKIAYITGGSKGIGFGIAESILREGGKVAITSRSLAAAEKAANELIAKTKNENVLPLEADVRSLSSQEAAIKAIIQKFGRIDVSVANAGIGHFGSIEDLTEEQWKDTIDTNLTGVFNTIKASLNGLKETKGYFITIGSLAGTNFFAGGSAYNASKFGVTGFTQAAMLDIRKYGIRATTIMPGSVATHFNDHTPSDADAWKIQIEDIGEIVTGLLKLNARTLPSKIEVRPTMPPSAR